jgi:hypothetical protein
MHVVVIQAVKHHTAIPARTDQPSFTQDPQLVGDPGAIDASGGREVTDAQFSGCKRGQHAQTVGGRLARAVRAAKTAVGWIAATSQSSGDEFAEGTVDMCAMAHIS